MFWRDFFFNKRLSPLFKYQLISVLIMYSTGTVTLKSNVTAYHLSSTIELQYNLVNPLKEIRLIIQFYLEHCNCTETLCSDQ